MLRVGRADKVVVGRVEQIADLPYLARDLVYIFLGRNAGRGRVLLNLLPVLVGAGQKENIIALQPLIPRQRVGQHNLIAVADVRLAGGVGDRGGNIKFRFIHDGGHPFATPFETLLYFKQACLFARPPRQKRRDMLYYYKPKMKKFQPKSGFSSGMPGGDFLLPAGRKYCIL